METILSIKIDHLEYINSQAQLKESYDSKGVRLDVYVKEPDAVYDIEMQAVMKKDLPKRSRYYQSCIDSANLEKGSTVKYELLPESYVIFICMDDPFHAGLAYYKFENISLEQNKKVYLQDGAYKIFLNPKGTATDLDPELAAFLAYLVDGTPTTSLTKDIELAVRKSRKNKEWRLEYVMMSLFERDARAAGYDEGREEGREEERRNIITLLNSNGMSPEDIARNLKLSLEQVLQYLQTQTK